MTNIYILQNNIFIKNKIIINMYSRKRSSFGGETGWNGQLWLYMHICAPPCAFDFEFSEHVAT